MKFVKINSLSIRLILVVLVGILSVTGCGGKKKKAALWPLGLLGGGGSSGISSTPVSNSGGTGDNSTGNGTSRPTLSYGSSSQSFVTGTAVNIPAPLLNGTGTCAFSVSPTLPADLSLNTSTGAIVGNPASVSPDTVYTITAACIGGNITANLTIGITAAPVALSGLSYGVGGNTNFSSTDPTVTLSPTISGTSPITYSVSPALPTGLSLNINTGVISGTPMTWSLSTTYTITSKNSVGSTTTTITFSTTTPGVVTGTGVTKCYNAYQEIPCGDTIFPNQEADFPKPRSFTGPTQHPTYTNDYTTRDNVKGLVWKSCLEGQSGVDCALGVPVYLNWNDAVNSCANLNLANSGEGYAGIKTWRLPSMQELFTSIDSSINYTISPYSPSYFPNRPIYSIENPSNNFIESLSSRLWLFIQPALQDHAFFSINGNSTSYNPRCVSGVTLPRPSFIDNAGATVKDNTSKLTWQKCTAGLTGSNCETGTPTLMGWQSALQYCKDLTLSGKNWRLPSMNELATIKDYEKYDIPFINASVFPNTPTSSSFNPPFYQYATATFLATSGACSRIYFFTFGDPGNYLCPQTNINDPNFNVRCVTD